MSKQQTQISQLLPVFGKTDRKPESVMEGFPSIRNGCAAPASNVIIVPNFVRFKKNSEYTSI